MTAPDLLVALMRLSKQTVVDWRETGRGGRFAVAFSWIAFPLIPALADLGVKDEYIAMTVGVVLFLLPVEPRKGIVVLDWNTASTT
ncbi:MAG: hypothetical protein LBG11_05835 [Bifidobacteriaceae bacterium]|nr:hypothetical protein [Bifidobacteriaceae bacterium]